MGKLLENVSKAASQVVTRGHRTPWLQDELAVDIMMHVQPAATKDDSMRVYLISVQIKPSPL